GAPATTPSQQKVAPRCQGLACHSRLAIEFCSGGAHGWQRAVRSARLRATSRQLLRRAYHRPPPHSIPGLAPLAPSLPDLSLEDFLCALGGDCLCLSQIFLRSSSTYSRVKFLTPPPH